MSTRQLSWRVVDINRPDLSPVTALSLPRLRTARHWPPRRSPMVTLVYRQWRPHPAVVTTVQATAGRNERLSIPPRRLPCSRLTCGACGFLGGRWSRVEITRTGQTYSGGYTAGVLAPLVLAPLITPHVATPAYAFAPLCSVPSQVLWGHVRCRSSSPLPVVSVAAIVLLVAEPRFRVKRRLLILSKRRRNLRSGCSCP